MGMHLASGMCHIGTQNAGKGRGGVVPSITHEYAHHTVSMVNVSVCLMNGAALITTADLFVWCFIHLVQGDSHAKTRSQGDPVCISIQPNFMTCILYIAGSSLKCIYVGNHFISLAALSKPIAQRPS